MILVFTCNLLRKTVDMTIKAHLKAASLWVCVLGGWGVMPAMAQSVKYEHLSRATISGHKIQIGYGLQANRDCSLDGYPAIKITAAPSHGRLSIEKGKIIPSYPLNNPRHRCNNSKLSAMVVYYTPSAAFAGRDFVEMVTSFINGEVTDTKIDIEVK